MSIRWSLLRLTELPASGGLPVADCRRRDGRAGSTSGEVEVDVEP